MTTETRPGMILPNGQEITEYAESELMNLFELTPEEAVRLAPPSVRTLEELFRELHHMGAEGIEARRQELAALPPVAEEAPAAEEAPKREWPTCADCGHKVNTPEHKAHKKAEEAEDAEAANG